MEKLKSYSKRILALLLAFVLTVGQVPATVFAAETGDTDDGLPKTAVTPSEDNVKVGAIANPFKLTARLTRVDWNPVTKPEGNGADAGNGSDSGTEGGTSGTKKQTNGTASGTGGNTAPGGSSATSGMPGKPGTEPVKKYQYKVELLNHKNAPQDFGKDVKWYETKDAKDPIVRDRGDRAESLISESETVKAVAANGTGKLLIPSFTVKDLLGNFAGDIHVSANNRATSTSTTLKSVNGDYEAKTFFIDRSAPEPAQITLTRNTDPIRSEGGLAYYKSDVNYTLDVTDENDSLNSGIQKVEWCVPGVSGLEDFRLLDSSKEVVIPVAAGQEFQAAALKIKVTDETGNTAIFEKQLDIVVDDKASVVEVIWDKTSTNAFYNGRTATVKVTDLSFDPNGVTLDWTLGNPDAFTRVGESSTYEAKVHFEQEGSCAFQVTAVSDLLNNQQSTLPSKEIFVIDKAGPVIQTRIISNDTAPRTINGRDYYREPMTVEVTLSDEHLDVASIHTTNLEPADNTDPSATTRVYYRRIVTDGSMSQKDFSITAKDLAGNTFKPAEGAQISSTTGEYNGNQVIVDMTAPEVVITQNADPVHTVGGRDYYNQDVTYTIKVRDTNLTAEDSGVANVIYKGETTNLLTTSQTDGWYQHQITLSDGESLSADELKVQVNDNLLQNPNAEISGFNRTENTYTYSGNQIIVDKTPLSATIVFGEPVKAVYTHTDNSDPMNPKEEIYLQLVSPVTGESGKDSQAEPITVSYTVTVKDKNLATQGTAGYIVKSTAGEFEGTIQVNADSTLTVSPALEVAADTVSVVKLDLYLADLAGNTLDSIMVTAGSSGVQIVPDAADPAHFEKNFHVDRRRPTSGAEDVLPVITVDCDLPAYTLNGLPIYNKDFNWKATVTDPDSGIQEITYKVTEPGGAVTEVNELVEGEDAESKDLNSTIQVVSSHETTGGRLEIKAADNAGNAITYFKEFGVDTKAPEVNVITQSMDTPTGDSWYALPVTVKV